MSIGSLVACSIALYAVLSSGFGTISAAASPEPQLKVLSERVAAVRDELRSLTPGKRAAHARRAVLAAMEAREDAAKWLSIRMRSGARVQAAERLTNSLDALEDWLDAVGSTLSNPNSPRRSELGAVGRRVHAAFASLPKRMGFTGAAGGEQRLLEFTASRR